MTSDLVTVHDFSRAAKASKENWTLAPGFAGIAPGIQPSSTESPRNPKPICCSRFVEQLQRENLGCPSAHPGSG